MSYNAFFEYMNTYADIMYAYGASAAIRHDDGHPVPYRYLWHQLLIGVEAVVHLPAISVCKSVL